MLVVYTCWLGGYEDVLQPVACARNPRVDYRCFTDDATFAVRGWRMLPVPRESDPVRQARRLKILAHETVSDALCSLWLDASFELLVDPWSIAERWLWQTDMVAMRHPDRTTIQQEGEEIVRLGRAPAGPVAAQLLRYQAEGFNPDQQTVLTSTGFCLRRHTARVIAFNKLWWRLFDDAGHTRDQMSIDVALSRSSVDLTYLAGHYRENPYARFYSARAGRERAAARMGPAAPAPPAQLVGRRPSTPSRPLSRVRR